MKLDLNKNYKDLDGNDLVDRDTNDKLNMGKQLAVILSQRTPQIEALKAFDWALALHKGNPIEIDKTDLIKLIKFIESCEGLSNLAKAQLLQLCDIK